MSFLDQLKQRKLVQWLLAYAAGAWRGELGELIVRLVAHGDAWLHDCRRYRLLHRPAAGLVSR